MIAAIHEESRGTYGWPRVHAELVLGETVNRKRVARLMREAGLQGVHRRKGRKNLASTATEEDLVHRQFAVAELDRLWLTDITEHPTTEGKVYCAAVMDACSRRIIGWNLPDGWVISERPAHSALVSEADFIAAQDVSAARGPGPCDDDMSTPGKRRYLLAGLLACGTCGRRMESAWSNGKPAYRCRHGHTTAAPPDPGRPGNAHVREDRILPRLSALHLLLTETQPPASRRRRTRRGADARLPAASPEDVIGYLRD